MEERSSSTHQFGGAPRARRRRHLFVALFTGGLALLPPSPAHGQVMVVGTAHLSRLNPTPSVAQRLAVVDRLAAFEPTLVCVEAIPGERVQQFAGNPQQYGELLATFARDAVRLAPEQQLRLSVDGKAARAEARTLEQRPGTLDAPTRLRLIALQLAGYEPWSALLNWTALTNAERDAAQERLGRDAAERLRTLSDSPNEIASIAIPLARRMGHRRLCAADIFADELGVQSLEQELLPLLQDSTIARALESLNARQAAHWHAERPDGLVTLYSWMNSDEYATMDRSAEWEPFARGAALHDAGKRRLALWHARNSDIAAHVFRAMASAEGKRTLLVIGASHRPFIEQALRAQPWVDVVPAAARLVP